MRRLALAVLIIAGCTPGSDDPWGPGPHVRSPIVMELAGDRLLVQHPETGLNVFDVTTPTEPVPVTRIAETAWSSPPRDFLVRGERVYLSHDDIPAHCYFSAGLEDVMLLGVRSRVDVVERLPHTPRHGATLCLPGYLRGVYPDERSVVVVLSFATDLLVAEIDVTSSEPRLVRHMLFTDREQAVTSLAVGDDIVVVEWTSSALILDYIDTSDPGTFSMRSNLALPVQSGWDVHTYNVGSALHLVAPVSSMIGAHLFVVDVSDPDAMTAAGHADGIASGYILEDVVFADENVYIVTRSSESGCPPSRVDVFHLGFDPDPWPLGHSGLPGCLELFEATSSGFVAVGRDESGTVLDIGVYGVGSLGAPFQKDRLEVEMPEVPDPRFLTHSSVSLVTRGYEQFLVVPYSRALYDGYTCIPDRHLLIVDVTGDELALRGDWIPPLLVGSRVHDVQVVMDYLYLATERSVTVLDVSDRDHPTSSVSASLGPRVDDSCDIDPATIGDFIDEVVSVLPVGCSVAWAGGVPWVWLGLVLVAIAVIRLRRS